MHVIVPAHGTRSFKAVDGFIVSAPPPTRSLVQTTPMRPFCRPPAGFSHICAGLSQTEDRLCVHVLKAGNSAAHHKRSAVPSPFHVRVLGPACVGPHVLHPRRSPQQAGMIPRLHHGLDPPHGSRQCVAEPVQKWQTRVWCETSCGAVRSSTTTRWTYECRSSESANLGKQRNRVLVEPNGVCQTQHGKKNTPTRSSCAAFTGDNGALHTPRGSTR